MKKKILLLIILIISFTFCACKVQEDEFESTEVIMTEINSPEPSPVPVPTPTIATTPIKEPDELDLLETTESLVYISLRNIDTLKNIFDLKKIEIDMLIKNQTIYIIADYFLPESSVIYPSLYYKDKDITLIFDGDNNDSLIRAIQLKQPNSFSVKGAKPKMTFDEIFEHLDSVSIEKTWIANKKNSIYRVRYEINGLYFDFISNNEDGESSYLLISPIISQIETFQYEELEIISKRNAIDILLEYIYSSDDDSEESLATFSFYDNNELWGYEGLGSDYLNDTLITMVLEYVGKTNSNSHYVFWFHERHYFEGEYSHDISSNVYAVNIITGQIIAEHISLENDTIEWFEGFP